MITVLISDPYLELVEPKVLEQAAQAVVDHHTLETESDITIVIDDDDRLQELNKEYLGIDTPTDVLSFPSGGDEIDPDSGHAYLGDVIVSYPRAYEQSQAAGHGVLDEIQLLVIHGCLHLLGYDHASPEEKTEMWQVQQDILQAVGVHINRLPESFELL
jgi:probable rRNA maturation factor